MKKDGVIVMAMAWIWTAMIFLSLVFAVRNGQGGALAAAAMDGAQKGITVGLSIAGPLCLWSGFGTLLRRSGLNGGLSKLLRPIIARLFPNACRDREASDYISANLTANLLGLGNAATPMGIAAVRRMKALSDTAAADDELCRFVVLNTASFQILPTTVAALRAAAGAAKPFDILLPVWLTSACSVSVGLLCTKLFQKRR